MRQQSWAAAACLVAALLVGVVAADKRVPALKAREAASKSKIITFTEDDFNEYALSPDRPYHLVFFGSSRRLMDSPKLQLDALKTEYTYTAKAFKSMPENADRVFFVDMWHDDASPVFSRLGLQALPALWHWGPAQAGTPGKKVALPEAAKCGPGISKYPWPAENIAEFVKGRTSMPHAPIDRPSFIKSPLFPLAALVALAGGGLVAWRLYNSWIVRITWLWGLGALVVYGFSTSGGMFNIIRGMPMYIVERNGRLKWWMEGRQGQFGAEGFVMGSSYIFFSSTISLMVYALPHIKDGRIRSGVSVGAALLAAAVGRGIFSAYVSKTGISMRQFFRD
ncbi:MAG: hypothetical protein J3K34DRAFT_527603 [Monoraphidium minutum]|nr:MAG: hypothetical protein J3K34DRAFT_527603 [Monoraphidium minutum]